MGFFKSKAARELDVIIQSISMNMANNYKDAAQQSFVEYENKFAQFIENEKLKSSERSYYERQLDEFHSKLTGYTHKDQKPYWTE